MKEVPRPTFGELRYFSPPAGAGGRPAGHPGPGCRQPLRWLNLIRLPDGSRKAQSLTP
jgi:hypothetical protein